MFGWLHMFEHIVYVLDKYWHVSDVLRGRKRFSRPINKAVEEDEAGEPCPHPEDHRKWHAHIIDQLKDKTCWFSMLCCRRKVFESISAVQVLFVRYLDSWEGDSRGGIGANHERKNRRAHISKHIRQLGKSIKKRES